MIALAGVDVGGSHTEVAISGSDLVPLARKHGAGAALESGRVAESVEIVAQLVRRAVHEAGLDSQLRAVVVGSAGAGNVALRDEFKAGMSAELGDDCALLVTSDAAIALESAHGTAPGILVASGTGSFGFARDCAGKIWRVGGLGWQHGDQGSGYSVSLAAIQLAIEAPLDRGPSVLRRALESALGSDSLEQSAAQLKSGDRSRVAPLARAVCDAASSGDHNAQRVVNDAARELARHCYALMGLFPEGGGPVPVALAGGMLRQGSPVRQLLLNIVETRRSDARFFAVDVDPALGALTMAARILSG